MNPRERFATNPFFVLGLAPDAARAEVERTAKRLLAELAIGRESARHYRTPVGIEERSEERVRAAAAELSNPARRLVHEVWAKVPVNDYQRPAVADFTAAHALRLFGVRAPKKV